MAKPLLKNDKNNLMSSRLLGRGSPLRAVSKTQPIEQPVEETHSFPVVEEVLEHPQEISTKEISPSKEHVQIIQTKAPEIEIPVAPKAVLLTPRVKPAKTKSRDILLDQDQDDVIEEIASIFRSATGTRPSASNILRATLEIMKSHIPAIRSEAARVGELRRPSYSAGHNAVVKEYESALAQAIGRGLKG